MRTVKDPRPLCHCEVDAPLDRPHPQYGWDFPEEIPEKFGTPPETLSELFLEFPSRVRLGSPFQSSPPPSTAGDASFFRSGSGEGLSEPGHASPSSTEEFLTRRPEKPQIRCKVTKN